MIRILAISALLASSVIGANAQSDEGTRYPTPEALAVDLSEAFRESDFTRAAALMHPEALARIQALVLDLAALDPQSARMFAGDSDDADLEQASPEETFARFMGGLFGMQPEMRELLGSLDTEVLGHVLEGDTLAHVVTRGRMSAMGINMTKMQVVSVKQSEGEWRALLSGDITNLTEAIRARLREGEMD